jgi:hypothetical protein
VVSDIAAGTGIGASKFAIGYRGTTSASRTDRLVIDASGNVGIGTNAPSNTMHIYKASEDQTTGLFIEKATGASGTASIFFGVTSTGETNNAGVPKAAILYQRTASNGRGDLKICNNNVDNTNAVGVADAKITIKGTGNVGIGTNSPGTKLGVDGSFTCRNFHALGNGNPLSNFVMREAAANNTNTLTETIRLNAPGRPTVVKVNYQGGSVAGALQRAYSSEITFNWNGSTTLAVSTLYVHNNGGTWSISTSVVSNGTVTLQVTAPGAASYNSLLTQWYNVGGIYVE